jgi:Uma2 family endonuclease
MTPEEYLALPEEKPYLEYVDGMVMQKPMPSKIHSILALRIGYFLQLWAGPKGLVGVEARARLGDLPNYRLPDVSYWKPGPPSHEDAPPTLAVEVRSKDQTIEELRRKCEFFRSTGVEACWLIDPIGRTAELFEGRRTAGTRVTALRAECVPGFELSLAELFSVLEDLAE